MINVSNAFKNALKQNQRPFLSRVHIAFGGGSSIDLTNEELWNGGFLIEDAVSDDNQFTSVGSTIINSATIIINNIDDSYTAYDFADSIITLYVGLEIGTSVEEVQKGIYTVDETQYNGSLITLYLLDYMAQFDRPYDATGLTYPATIYDVVYHACGKCNVLLGTNDFPNKTFVAPSAPDSSTTFREVIGWCAAIAGCYARCNKQGKLCIEWYDTEYLDTDEYDNEDLEESGHVHVFDALYDINVAVDDVVITGVKVSVEDKTNSSANPVTEYTSGSNGYVVSVEGNQFLTNSNAASYTSYLANRIIGITFRKATIDHLSDPTIEAGDIALVYAPKNKTYRILVSRTTFNIDSTQTTISAAETPTRNSSSRFKSNTRNYVVLRKLLFGERTSWEQAYSELGRAIQASSGLYSTIVTNQDQSHIYYLHDKVTLAESEIVWKMTAEGWAVTDDWQGSDTATTEAGKWNAGVTVNGNIIANILNTIGVNAGWIRSGEIVIKSVDGTNETITFYANTATGQVDINANSFSLRGTPLPETVGKVQYGTCPTAASTQQKAVTCNNFVLYTGAQLTVSFTNTNTVANPQLNVNSTGNKGIRINGSTQLAADSPYNWKAGSSVHFIYDGTYWQIVDSSALSKLNDFDTALNQTEVFNRLTNNGETQGIYLSSASGTPKLYINAEYIKSGFLQIKDSNNVETFYADTATGTVRINANSISIGGTTLADYTDNRIDLDEGRKYRVCAAAANTAAKTITITGFRLYNREKISVKFNNTNTANNPTLQILDGNGDAITSAIRIQAYGNNLTSDSPYNWQAGAIVDFIYDGTYWQIADSGALAALNSFDTELNQTEVFNRLTNNGTNAGLFLENNKLYINADYVRTGILRVGGKNTGTDGDYGGGIIQMHKDDSAQTRFARIDKTGIYFGGIPTGTSLSSAKFIVDATGACTAKSFTANDYVYVNGTSQSFFKIPITVWNTTYTDSSGILIVGSDADGYVSMGQLGFNVRYYNTPGSTSAYHDLLIGSPDLWKEKDKDELVDNPSLLDQLKHEVDYPLIYGKNSANNMGVVIGREGFFAYSSRSGSNGGYGKLTINTFVGGKISSNSNGTTVTGNFTVSGTKSRVFDTEDYGNRKLYAYETPSPYFGDIGDGKINSDGSCYIAIEPIFGKTIVSNYQVFLQKYGTGDCYVAERKSSYFVVMGTPNLEFGWELKAKQVDYAQYRLEQDFEMNSSGREIDYGDEAAEYLEQLRAEREGGVA